MLIEIQETHPAAPGKKMAAVVAAGGQRYGVWPEMLANLRIGGRYEVEVEAREYNGRTFEKIVKAMPANGAAHTNGAASANGNTVTPAGASTTDGEAEFVGRALAAFILKGEVPMHMQRVLDATLMLREVWRITARQVNANGGGHG
jgi:hypothetical protein